MKGFFLSLSQLTSKSIPTTTETRISYFSMLYIFPKPKKKTNILMENTLLIRTHVRILFWTFNVVLLCLGKAQAQTDRLSQGQIFNDSSSLVSAGNKFMLGFFSRGNSNRRYLGIWYNEVPGQTLVWVANRQIPLNDSSGILRFGNDGNLIIESSRGEVSWSTVIHSSPASGAAVVAQLLDSGNLVLKHADDPYLWQSFDHPTDIFLEGMKLGWDLRTGLNRNLTSWRTNDDPFPGDFSYAIDPDIYPQVVLRKGSTKLYRGGPYDFQVSDGKMVRRNSFFVLNFISNQQEVYAEFELNDTLSMTVLTYSGEIERSVWDTRNRVWIQIGTHPGDPCDSYNRCGPNAVCRVNASPRTCSCLTGYRPRSSEGGDMALSSDGCIRKNLNCSLNTEFVEMTGVKIPDVLSFRMESNMNLEECRNECLKNCSCTAFSNGDTGGGDSGNCLLWHSDLLDLRRFAIYDDLRFYVRVTVDDLDSSSHSKNKSGIKIIAITVPVAFALLISVLACILIRCRRRKQVHLKDNEPVIQPSGMQELELPSFEMSTVTEATNSFSNSNKIGEGGFGPVYKGQLATGQDIAVKILSVDSKQGLTEFKNEVILISKLQHRNLVRLLGCCISGADRMLIYEYMPNRSLDNYIYDSETRKALNWTMRYNIVIGIARGLLYLHRDSRLRIVHRDLKASNVLLDSEMNPKISDFGTARAFKEEQLSDKTTRVVGTYGYMAPEYITKGLYSMKSDVFSFGVLLLEIISGRRNREFHPDHDLSLLGHAWKLWTEGNVCKLIDELMDKFPTLEVERCVHVGLLCVQRRPEDRPTMSSVLLILDTKNTPLPRPNQPEFFSTTISVNNGAEGSHSTEAPSNDVTQTEIYGR